MFVQSFVRANPRITYAIVVGSVARGTDGPRSDVDLRLFSTGMQRGDLPLREAGCWQGDVYVDVSEVPDVWLDDPRWIAGCPRHGSLIRFGRVLVDPDGRLAKCLAAVIEVFDRPEYHARRVRIFRDIVERRLEHARQVLGGQCRTETHIALGFSIIDASLMPALCTGVSPQTVQSMIQLRRISRRLFDRFVGIVVPAALDPEMVRKWLEDPDLVDASRARDFTWHLYGEVMWMAQQGQTIAAHHLLWALRQDNPRQAR